MNLLDNCILCHHDRQNHRGDMTCAVDSCICIIGPHSRKWFRARGSIYA